MLKFQKPKNIGSLTWILLVLIKKKKCNVQVISILPQSDDELLKNSKYITDRTFWKIIFEMSLSRWKFWHFILVRIFFFEWRGSNKSDENTLFFIRTSKIQVNVLMSVQGQMGGSFIMKMLCPLYLFFSWGLSGAAQRQTGGSFSRKKVISTASIFLWCHG